MSLPVSSRCLAGMVAVCMLAACRSTPPPQGTVQPDGGSPPAIRESSTSSATGAASHETFTETPRVNPSPDSGDAPRKVEVTPFRCLETNTTIEDLPLVDIQSIVQTGHTSNLPPSPAKNEPLIVEGMVFAGDCTPLAGVNIHVWHTDNEGNYGPPGGGPDLECCYFDGNVRSDDHGRFRLVAVRPGAYQGTSQPPPAHIHVEASHPEAMRFGTEIVFADDPYLIPSQAGLDGYTVVLPQPFKGGDDLERFALVEFVMQRASSPDPTLTSTQVPQAGDGFNIIPGESRAYYVIREQFARLVDLTVAEAVTPDVEGELRLDLDGPLMLLSMKVKVDLRSLKSDDPQRDEKLPDRWLETNRYPYAEFTAGEVPIGVQSFVEGQEYAFDLPGQMTIHGQTRPVTFRAIARLEREAVSSPWRLVGRADTTLRMSDFGIAPPDLLGFVVVEDEVRVRVELTAQDVTD